MRTGALRLLADACDGDVTLAREIEAICRAASLTSAEYGDAVRRAATNLKLVDRAQRSPELAFLSDGDVARGTLIGEVERERLMRKERFEAMLQSKMDSLTNDTAVEAIVKCRRCGSTDIHFSEKQTRSADEAASVFCTCLRCKLQWVIR